MDDLHPTLARLRVVLLAVALLTVRPPSAAAQDAAAYFDENCGACHTVGDGELNGPDLKGVTESRDIEWLRRFIASPEAMVASKDHHAVELLEKYDGALMPTPEGLTPQLLDQLIQHIDRLSRGSGASSPESPPADVPFTDAEAAAGEALFTGAIRLSGGGAACNACHTVRPRAAFGGGRLGPELTLVRDRMRGSRGLQAWLKAPATPVMRRLFENQALSPEEVRALTAYLDRAGTAPLPPPSRISHTFLLSGVLGALVAVVVLDRAWRARLSRLRRVDRHTISR